MIVLRNAIILAAGTSSRFVPLSQQIPKGLLRVRGEVLIERQIRQLRKAGITDITLVVGYKAEMFSYLVEKFGVDIVLNEDYKRFNNTSSMIRVLDRLGNTFICSSDNYFTENVFMGNPEQSYYSALFANGPTNEYCMECDSDDVIRNVHVGGRDAWYMIGHVYFSEDFSNSFKEILQKEYVEENVRHSYWEDVFIKHIARFPPMKVNRYAPEVIKEFDSLDELRLFDHKYINHTGSKFIEEISRRLNCCEGSLNSFVNITTQDGTLRFSFNKDSERYVYDDRANTIEKI